MTLGITPKAGGRISCTLSRKAVYLSGYSHRTNSLIRVGQNPTGGTLGVQRRKDIYEVCVKFDVVIIEDDPYWYLQYPSATCLSQSQKPDSSASKKSSGYKFLDSLVPSYLSVDYQGRVIRLDTFSKTIAPGCRLGWITTQPALCERLLRITESSTQQPSGFVQSMIAELIMGPHNKHGHDGGKDSNGWQTDGWVRWLEGLRGNYERRMNTMSDILDSGKELVKLGRRRSIPDEWSIIDKVSLYDFVRPTGGMFIWIHMNYESHPLWKRTTPQNLAQALWVHLTTPKYLVLVAPGAIFSPTEHILEERSWAYFRLCFAAVDEPEVEQMSRRFVEGVQHFWQLKSLDDLEELNVEGIETYEILTDLRGFC